MQPQGRLLREPFSAISEEHCPAKEADAGDDTDENGDDDQVAHDVAGVQAGNTQSRQSPEGLDHVGPLVAPGNTHGCTAELDAHLLGSRHNDGALDGPLAAAGRNEEVDDTGTQEGGHGEGAPARPRRGEA